MRVKLTLANHFHGTTATIAPTLDPAYGRLWSTWPTLARAARKLCPSRRSGCPCESSPVIAAFYNGPGHDLGRNGDEVWANRAEVERVYGRKVEG